VAISTDQFVQQLVESSLMSPADITAIVDSLPAERKPHDGEQLAASARKSRSLSQPGPATAVKSKPAPDPVADPEVTQDWSGLRVATDPRTEQLLPGRRIPAAAAKKAARPPKPPWWQDRKVSAAAGAAAFLLLVLGVWVIIRDKDDKEIARIQLPEGGSVSQEPIPTLPAPVLEKPEHRSAPAASEPQPLPPWDLLPGSPPPAIAPFDAAKAKEHQAAWAKYLGVEVELENSIGMRFVLIPPVETRPAFCLESRSGIRAGGRSSGGERELERHEGVLHLAIGEGRRKDAPAERSPVGVCLPGGDDDEVVFG
jgi:hypothetical protein